VDETDRVWNQLISREKVAGLPARFHRKFPASSGTMLFEQLVSDNTTAGLKMLLLERVTRVCGAMRIQSDLALDNAQPLLELDGDDLYSCTADLSEGIILSMVEDIIEGTTQQLIEVSVWGKHLRRSIEQRLLNVLG
jgi:hypothetical protein